MPRRVGYGGRMRRAVTLLFALALLAALGAGAFLYWKHSEQERIVRELSARLDRVWARSLVADLKAERVVGGERPQMVLTFVEYAPGTETPVLKRRLELPGEEVYIDALVVRFERHFVEAGDGLRGHSLLLFRRAFSDRMRPVDGIPLYTGGPAPLVPGAPPQESPVPAAPEVPVLYRVDPVPSHFERRIWARFWQLASDPAAAAAEGVRVAQGEAPHLRPVEGQVYRLDLRADGGLEITPRLPAAVVGENPQAGGASGRPAAGAAAADTRP
ncbi:MAG: hypothetical protein D6729_06375 [Deltaproteobacteria bacterium]|nr:MAG: hypothetical protein D6729_06375 [Deltaproteobacteria bacterium]